MVTRRCGGRCLTSARLQMVTSSRCGGEFSDGGGCLGAAALFYKLVTQGQAPATFRVGTRVLVSKESAARWRAEREAAAEAEPGSKKPPQSRTRCRNPRCAGQLKIPADNPRDAFCCQGCEHAYYRSRCRVCERLFSRKTERRVVCGREKCRYEWKRYPEQFFGARYPSSPIAHNASRSAHSTGLKSGLKSGRGWRIIAVARGTADPARHAAAQRRRRLQISKRAADRPGS